MTTEVGSAFLRVAIWMLKRGFTMFANEIRPEFGGVNNLEEFIPDLSCFLALERPFKCFACILPLGLIYRGLLVIP